MKLKYKFVITELDGKKTAVPVDRGARELHAIINLNDSGAEIMRLLADETTEDEVVSKLLAIYKSSEADIRAGVQKMVEELTKIGVLEV